MVTRSCFLSFAAFRTPSSRWDLRFPLCVGSMFAFGRGDEQFMGIFGFFDVLPKGREEYGPYHSIPIGRRFTTSMTGTTRTRVDARRADCRFANYSAHFFANYLAHHNASVTKRAPMLVTYAPFVYRYEI